MAKSRRRGRSGRPWRETAVRTGLLLAEAALWLWLVAVWWIHDETAKDAFRLPKDVVSQALVLASLVFLTTRLLAVDKVSPGRLWALPALRASLPLVFAAALSWPGSDHPLHVERALLALAVGAAALVGWSAGLGRHRLQRLLQGLLFPAAALSIVGILQYHGLYRPFDFQGNLEAERLGVTSFAGSAGDLAVFLVLPLLVAQWSLYCWWSRGEETKEGVKRSWLFGAALVLCLYAVAVTQTLTAVVALGVSTAVLWVFLLPTRKALAGLALTAILAGLLVVAVEPLRERVGQKARMLSRGRVNAVLTGRLDGWKAAVWMLRQSPVTGVGHGAYRAEFGDAKFALLEEGSDFLRSQYQVMFANAHSEPLEVAAETGLVGLVALIWGLWQLFLALRRRSPSAPETALAWAGATALALLCLGQFPFRLTLTAVPAVLFLAWVFATAEVPEGKPREEAP